ncbi:MAG: hypothetical protein JNK87_33390 [Bryobacterales bacterium]|nr:hypothetical protein [Bryobacterales bacterium]
MDLFKAIEELHEEKRRLDEVIAHLEALSQARDKGAEPAPARKRGRKGMSEEERAEVSARMKEFWAEKRKTKSK